jgi:hemolysin activation/secretion protein
MAISFRNKILVTQLRLRPRPRHAAALLAAMALYPAPILLAASPPIVTPNPEQEGLPSIRREEAVPNKEVATPSLPEVESAIAEQVLPSAIRQITVESPLLSAEIKKLLNPFIGKDRVTGKALEQVRGQIWDLYRQRGRLVRVELRAVPGVEAEGGSTLQARIEEISVRTVRVEEEGGTALKQSLLDDILAGVKADLSDGGALDLDRLDSRLKRRIFLRDVSVRAALIPVDSGYVDVNVLVRAAPSEPLAWLVQTDNNGMRTYGRNRSIAAVSIPGHVLPGDQIDILAMTSSGLAYGRAGYEFPLVQWGARLNIWGSRLDYRVPSVTNGNATLLGAGLTFPLYIDNRSTWTGYANYLHRYEAGKLADNTPSANKITNSVQGKVDGSYAINQTQSLHLTMSMTLGILDLSALKAAAAQDQASAKTDGSFTKLEFGAGWNALLGQSGKFDSRLDVKGQLASKNLDQSEKLPLGGLFGVRAYSASEGLGDEGYIASADLGYRPINGLRIFGFYDIGRTRLYKRPFGPLDTPTQYTLQGTGVGLTYAYKSLVSSATYARQVGANPGLSATGRDADGSTHRSRLWLSLTWRM